MMFISLELALEYLKLGEFYLFIYISLMREVKVYCEALVSIVAALNGGFTAATTAEGILVLAYYIAF